MWTPCGVTVSPSGLRLPQGRSSQQLTQVVEGLLDGLALAGDFDLEAARNVPVGLVGDCGGELNVGHGKQYVPRRTRRASPLLAASRRARRTLRFQRGSYVHVIPDAGSGSSQSSASMA